MAKQITKLTDKQIAKMGEYVERFLKLGLCTDPFTAESKSEISEIMDRVYANGGLPPPQFKIYLDSPLACLYGFAYFEEIIKAGLLPKLASQAQSQVESQVESQVRSQVGSQVWSQVRSQVRSQVGSQVESQVWSQVGSQVESQVGSQVWSQHSNFCWGSQSAGWLSYYNYIDKELHTINTHQLQPLIDLVGHCSFYLPYKDVVFISQNPSVLKMEAGLLHNTTGPSWSYADGFCGRTLDGVAMPEEAFNAMKAKDAAAIMAIPNVEHRLLAIKYAGIEHLLSQLSAKVLDTKGTEYELLEVVLEGSAEKLLKMQNPSEPKVHYEFVAPEIMTVNQALAWRIGWDLNKFKEPVAKT